jgi:hypothetical protein
MPPRIVIELSGKFIPLPTFTDAVDDLCDILAQLDVSISGKEHLQWGINRNSRSKDKSILEAVPRIVKGYTIADNLSHKIVPAFLNGMRVINKKPIRPEFFSDAALDSAKELAAITNGDVNKVRILGSVNGRMSRPVPISPKMMSNVDELIGPLYWAIGSVEGTLDTVSLHRSPRIFVYHSITRKAVRCKFPREMLEDIRRALGRRVIVSGLVQYNRQGDPIRVEMDSLRVMGIDNLPSTEDLSGSDEAFTGDMSTADYLRSIRG